MRDPDAFLIGWWVLLIGVTAASWAYRWSKTRHKAGEAEQASRQGPPVSAYPVLSPATALCIAGLALGWLLVIFGGAFGLLWMTRWTELSVLNARLCWILFGLALIWSAGHYTHRVRAQQVTGRVLAWLFGVPIAAIAGLEFTGDLVNDRHIVEGRVESVVLNRKKERYLLVVSGRTYEATREVLRRAREGERVRLTIGAGSGTVFTLEPVD